MLCTHLEAVLEATPVVFGVVQIVVNNIEQLQPHGIGRVPCRNDLDLNGHPAVRNAGTEALGIAWVPPFRSLQDVRILLADLPRHSAQRLRPDLRQRVVNCARPNGHVHINWLGASIALAQPRIHGRSQLHVLHNAGVQSDVRSCLRQGRPACNPARRNTGVADEDGQASVAFPDGQSFQVTVLVFSGVGLDGRCDGGGTAYLDIGVVYSLGHDAKPFGKGDVIEAERFGIRLSGHMFQHTSDLVLTLPGSWKRVGCWKNKQP